MSSSTVQVRVKQPIKGTVNSERRTTSNADVAADSSAISSNGSRFRKPFPNSSVTTRPKAVSTTMASKAATSVNTVTSRPQSHNASRVRSDGSTCASNNMKKASSCQNLKQITTFTGTIAKGQSNSSSLTLQNSRTARHPTVRQLKEQKQHGSAANLTDSCSKSGTSETLSSCDVDKSRCNAHRISANSDLLSRVEKEKKQYEARISELTQLTETRKIEIEKLTFELRHAKEDVTRANENTQLISQEVLQLRSKLESLKGLCNIDLESIVATEPLTTDAFSVTTTTYTSVEPCKTVASTGSPSESLGTTTRMTPGMTTAMTGTVTASSVVSDWNERMTLFDLFPADNVNKYNLTLGEDVVAELAQRFNVCSGSAGTGTKSIGSGGVSVATLQGRLLQMEEANYTTNEELQATLQELWDLQRSVDEAHEEARSLAFERAILLEALSTQTTKLEHCRFQIEQLKQLLLTNRNAQTPGSRENHFCELYASIEQEKQVLLAQNNDLAHSSDGLAKECRVLTEQAAQLQDSFDLLERDHASLQTAHQSILSELNALKASRVDISTVCSSLDNHTDADASISPVVQTENTNSAVELTRKLSDMNAKYNSLNEQFELLQAERERETTEWRLYERDLLKTVQVADSIKSESETKAERLTVENESLNTQNNQLRSDLTTVRKELAHVEEQLTIRMALSVAANSTSYLTPVKERVDVGVCTQMSPEPEKPALAKNNTAVRTVQENGYSATTNLLNNFPHSHQRASGISHSPHHHHHSQHPRLQSYTSSPGAPGRPSALTTGPTVRSLIQSIESQVKVVQHQQRGIASNTPGSNSTPYRHNLYTRSTIIKNPVSSTCSNQSQKKDSVTPVKSINGTSTRAARFTDPAISIGPGLSQSNENRSSAPGGPESRPHTGQVGAVPGTSVLGSATPQPKSRISVPSMGSQSACGFSPTNANVVEPTSEQPLPSSVLRRNNSVCIPGKCIASKDLRASEDPLYPTKHFDRVSSSTTSTPNKLKPTLQDSPALGSSFDHGSSRVSPKNTDIDSNSKIETSLAPTATSATLPGLQSTVINGSPNGADTADSSTTDASNSFIPHFWVDPLLELARRTAAGSKRNALLRWCQLRVACYQGVNVTNFSSSWNNGLALCALLHSYTPSKIPWNDLVTSNGTPVDKRRCFEIAFSVAESEGIPTTLHLHEMLTTERPDWSAVLSYITSIYKHYEVTPAVDTVGSPPTTSATNVSVTASNITTRLHQQ